MLARIRTQSHTVGALLFFLHFLLYLLYFSCVVFIAKCMRMVSLFSPCGPMYKCVFTVLRWYCCCWVVFFLSFLSFIETYTHALHYMPWNEYNNTLHSYRDWCGVVNRIAQLTHKIVCVSLEIRGSLVWIRFFSWCPVQFVIFQSVVRPCCVNALWIYIYINRQRSWNINRKHFNFGPYLAIAFWSMRLSFVVSETVKLFIFWKARQTDIYRPRLLDWKL